MKVKFSALVSDMRGKLNGSVASKNRGGSYLRNKVTPVNPNTSYQVAQKNRLTTQAQAWRGLTDAQRLAWNSAVSNFARTDIFGDLKNPSGFNLFCKLNSNLTMVGVAAINTPPTSTSVLNVSLGTLTAANGVPALSLTLSGAVPAGTEMVVNGTAPLSAGKSFVRSELRKFTTAAPAATSPVNLLASWNTKFGSMGAAGTKIFVEIYFINKTTGVASARQLTSCIVAA